MKINLLLDNPKGRLSGYLNVDPITQSPDQENCCQADINNFDSVCEDAEATEIIASEILTYFPAKDVDGILQYWLKKLGHGGILKIVEVDLIEVSKAVVSRVLSLEDANLLLYGSQQQPWQYRKCLLTINQIVEVLKNKGFRILKKKIEGFHLFVEAQRP